MELCLGMKLFKKIARCFYHKKIMPDGRVRARVLFWRFYLPGLPGRMPPCKRLVMTLLVRNEEAVVETHVRYHCAMGVDGVIVTAHRCTDGTVPILRRLQAEGLVFRIIEVDEVDFQQSRWVTDMVHMARDEYGADWVINADADEFFYSRRHDLKRSIDLQPGANVLRVSSLFSFPRYSGDYLQYSLFVVRRLNSEETERLGIAGDARFRVFLKEYESEICACKSMHRAEGCLWVETGNHRVQMSHARVEDAVDIVIYHFHVRNYAEWIKKIERYESSLLHLEPESRVGWHMREWLRKLHTPALEEEFCSAYSDEMREFLLRHSVLSYDDSLLSFMKAKGLLR